MRLLLEFPGPCLESASLWSFPSVTVVIKFGYRVSTIQGVYRENGKRNGSYYLGLRVLYRDSGLFQSLFKLILPIVVAVTDRRNDVKQACEQV